MTYEPQPIETSHIELPQDLIELTEELAKSAHDNWAAGRLAEGWTFGPTRDDSKKEHPTLVPYEDLPESEKEFDRTTAMQTLKAVLAMGYRIEREK